MGKSSPRNLLFTLLASACLAVDAFYLPGAAPKDYARGDDVGHSDHPRAVPLTYDDSNRYPCMSTL